MSDKKLGTTVTAWLKLKKKISKKNAEVEDLKSQAFVLEGEIIKAQEHAGIKRSDVALGSATLKKKNVHNVKDWGKVWAYIYKTKDTAILSHQRLANATLDEYLEDGVRIPGTEKMIKKTLSPGYKKGV